jgi:geranylgeranyl pyrophosphate synthase
LIDDSPDRAHQQIEQIWKLSGASPELIGAMRQVLPGHADKAHADQGHERWIQLPYLCCQAAGGNPLWADYLAAAWYLLFTAAHLMDKVEDRDEPDPSWAQQGSGVALSAATGLFFTASLALNELYRHEETRPAAAGVISDFYSGFLQMSSGQHADLIHPQPTLEQYWEIARDKSGAFFQVACRCGARLAAAAPERLEGFSRFGQHLGILKQILDDLEDIQPPGGPRPLRPWPEIASSLPVVYAMSVLPQEQRALLQLSLQNTLTSQPAAQEAYHLLEKSGAALYLSIEIERQRDQAIDAIQKATARPEDSQQLIELVQMLAPT